MQPVVHLAVAYLCYAAYTRWRRGVSPDGGPVLFLLLAAAIPDLLDKPLDAAGVVPVGRTVGHSLLFAVPLVAAVWLATRRVDRTELGVAFAIGYGSHVATDIPWHLLSGEYDELGFLLWPVTHMPEYTGVKPLATVGGVEVTTLWLEGVLLLVGIGLWWRDGRPGLETLRDALVNSAR